MTLPVLQLEPTDHCNLACKMCSPHADAWDTVHGVPKGFMPWALFAHIMDGLKADNCCFDHVILQWLGDPSLHPDLERMVGYAGHQLAGRMRYLRFDTNAVLLDERRIERMLLLKAPTTPLLVVVTLDAATEAVYQRVKGRDRLGLARRHVRALLRLRQGIPDVHVQVQFVVQAGNAHEVGPFLRYWQDAWVCHGQGGGHFEVMFKRLSVSGGAVGQEEADGRYEKALGDEGIFAEERPGFSVKVWDRRPWQRDDGHKDVVRGACPGLWFTPVIRQDGVLVMCCADLQSELALGSLQHHGFMELWQGEKAQKKRNEHRRGVFSGVCAACGGINWMAPPDP